MTQQLEPVSVALVEQARRVPPVMEVGAVLAREQARARLALYGRGPEMATCRDIAVGDAGAGPNARLMVPVGDTHGVVVYLHGGGWVLGDLDGFDTLARRLAADTGCVVVLVDYRRAPEHPFPAAFDDAWAATAWASGYAAERGVPLVVCGDSAGGNLAAAVTQAARADDSVRICGQVLLYPVTDCDFETASYRDPGCQQLLTADSMRWFWDQYAGSADRTDPRLSPLRAASCAGLPPAHVGLARFDPLRSEGESYAARLAECGVPVTVTTFEDQMHGFATLVNILPGADEARTFLERAVLTLLGSAPART